ncbi:MAG: purine-nucleoside phosphorylase [Candidatus Delongbacteria bacterium]|jgi:purine-nucleoside phosphorylase|nr:purine-nucleoside phosphorylase [Candidatus Delongbacteria bacterium]
MNKIAKAVNHIRSKINTDGIEYAVVLGSGLAFFTESLSEKETIKTSDVPNFPISTVRGHSGSIVVGKLNGKKILVLSGRVHLYEGYSYDEVVFPINVISELGIKNLILTNAAGCINDNYHPGDLILITMGKDPLHKIENAVEKEYGTSNKLNAKIINAAKNISLPLNNGSYGFMTGPTFETPSEIRLLKKLNIDLVGMSTVPEIMESINKNIQVSAISLATNYAAGISDQKLTHQDVFDTAKKAQKKLVSLLKEIVRA